MGNGNFSIVKMICLMLSELSQYMSKKGLYDCNAPGLIRCLVTRNFHNAGLKKYYTYELTIWGSSSETGLSKNHHVSEAIFGNCPGDSPS